MSFFKELKRRNVIRVAIAYAIVGWLLVEVASVVIPTLLLPDWTLRILVLFVILGLPLALIFAWAFELTPEGLKKEKDVDRSQSITHHTGRKLDRMIIALLVVALAFVIVDNYVLDRSVMDEGPARAQGVSIAVLPFVNMSNDPEQEYFSDGISEELLNLLTKIPEFRVAGRTSSFSFKGQNQDLREIGQSLGVENILEGSVRKGTDRVRITAQLVEADDGFHLWSETYDRKLDDIFAVQDDIASQVVKALKVTLLGEAAIPAPGKSAINNVEAYTAYLRGLYLYNKSGADNLGKAVQYMQEAVTLAPDSALAWAGLARALDDYAGQGAAEPVPLVARAREAASKALALDDKLPEAHLAVADLKRSWDWDWAGAEAALQRVLELRPGNVDAQKLQARLYVTFGRLEEAEQMTRIALTQDPLDDRLQRSLQAILLFQGRYDEAALLGERLLEHDPTMPYARTWLAVIYLEQGRAQEALEQAQQEPALFARLTGLAIVHHELGNRDKAVAAQQQLLEAYGDLASYQQAQIFAHRGELDTAIEWLERAYAGHDPGMENLKPSRAFFPLHGHPRYEELLRKMNLAD
jgi:serine/threonine-protein kinase